MKSIINGKIFLENKDSATADFKNKVVLFREKIEAILDPEEYAVQKDELGIEEEIDAFGNYVLPGFIDVHIHGYGGMDVMDAGLEELEVISMRLTENGITGFLPTTMTMSYERIDRALDTIQKGMKNKAGKGAMILGAHMEGPFINAGYKGAQAESDIIPPEESLIQKYKDCIKVLTIAPEIPGAFELIGKYSDHINFSLGHTGAGYETAMKAYRAGAKGTTHLFNAMTGLHHREPGAVGAALNWNCYVEIIADGKHINPALFQLIMKVKGQEKILLVTDCMRAGGEKDGIYDLGGQKVIVSGGACRLEDQTLAGSILRLNQGLFQFTEALLNEKEDLDALLLRTIPMVTKNQAVYLGLEKEMGSLENGKLANITFIDKEANIKMTIVKGKIQYEN